MNIPCDETETVTEAEVAEYLRRHPDFFVRHSVLLSELELPHDTGPATSLIERQVAVLRHLNRQYREQLQELVRIARDNDRLIERLQQLTLSLLDTDHFDRLVHLLRQALHADFQADAAVLHLTGVDPAPLPAFEDDGFLRITTHGAADGPPPELCKIINRRQPVCGRFNETLLHYLFGEQAGTVASAALLPLHLGSGEDGISGLLAIGSRDLRRFHAEMGTAYLRHMGELIGRRLHPHLTPAPGSVEHGPA